MLFNACDSQLLHPIGRSRPACQSTAVSWCLKCILQFTERWSLILFQQKKERLFLSYSALIDHLKWRGYYLFCFRCGYYLEILSHLLLTTCHALRYVFLLSSVGNEVRPGPFASPCASNDNFFLPLHLVKKNNPCRILAWIEIRSSSPSCQATAGESEGLGHPHPLSDWLWGHQTAYALQIWHRSVTHTQVMQGARWRCAFCFEEHERIINDISCAFVATSRRFVSHRWFLGKRCWARRLGRHSRK